MTCSNTFLVLCLTASFANGQTKNPNPEDRTRDKRKGPPRPEAFLKAFDSNADGTVSRAEFDAGERTSTLSEETRDKIFQRLDKDSDGFISSKELKGMKPKRGRDLLASADQNGDQKISKDEFAAHPPFEKLTEERRSELFERLDRNSDGFLDGKDGGRHGPRGWKLFPRLKMKELDLDESETLSWEEFQKAPMLLNLPEKGKRQVFDRIDSDESGELSAEEIRAHGEGRDGKDGRVGRREKKSQPKK